MESRFTVTRYQDNNSILTKFDPRVKLFAYILILVCIFSPLGMFGALLAFSLVFLIFSFSKISVKIYWKTLKPTVFILVFILILNTISISPPILGIWYAGIYGIKLWSMLLLASILTISTKMEDLTFALISVFKPLRIIRFPVEEFSLMISLGIRFIPDIFSDSQNILLAQKSRGLDTGSKKITSILKSIKLLFPPLLVNSFKRADDISNALISKGYVIGQKRTSYVIRRYSTKDLIPVIFSLLILGSYIFLMINPIASIDIQI